MMAAFWLQSNAAKPKGDERLLHTYSLEEVHSRSRREFAAVACCSHVDPSHADLLLSCDLRGSCSPVAEAVVGARDDQCQAQDKGQFTGFEVVCRAGPPACFLSLGIANQVVASPALPN
jgi:hypothetical protein